MQKNACSDGPPARSSALLRHYEAIAHASQEMAIAARNDQWDEFERLQRHCSRLIDALKAQGAVEDCSALNRIDGARRIALLGRMLAADADIRERTEPWSGRLNYWLGRMPPH